MRRPQRMSAKEVRPGGADEHATTLITASCKTVPRAGPAASGMFELPAPQAAAST